MLDTTTDPNQKLVRRASQNVASQSSVSTGRELRLNRWELLFRYTEQGGLSIDNNLFERTLHVIAIARKN